MAEATEKEKLDEFIAGTLERDNYDELVEHLYASFKTVDHAATSIREMKEEIEEASDDEERDLAQNLGILLFATGHYSEAVQYLEEVKRRKDAAFFLGRAYLELDNPAEAVSHLEKSRSSDGDFRTDALIAEAYCRQRDFEKAEEVCEDYEDERSEDPEMLYLRGRIAEVKGEYGLAMELYEQALDEDPEHREALFRLAYNCDLNGEDDRAEELYERCASVQPTCIGALINLGILKEDQGEYEEAIECYRRVLAIEPTHKRTQLFLRDAESALDMEVEDQYRRGLPEPPDMLSAPIDHFELSSRSRKCLDRLGIETLGDLTETSEQELIKSRNFGEASLQEIKQLLARNDLHLGSAVKENSEDDAEDPEDEEAGDEAAKLNLPIDSLNLSTRSRRCMDNLQIATVGELVENTEKELLQMPNFGRKSIEEIKMKLSSLGLELKSE